MRFLVEKSEEASILSNNFLNYAPDLRREKSLEYIKTLPNYNTILKNAGQYYAQKLADIDSSKDRQKYISYLAYLKTPSSVDTAEVIDQLADRNLLTLKINDDLGWINKLDYNQNGSEIRNTIKTIAFFNNENNRQKWGVSDPKTLLFDKKGNPKSYAQIANIISKLEGANKSSSYEISDAIMSLMDLGVKKEEAKALITKLYNAGDKATTLVQKAVKAMGESPI